MIATIISEYAASYAFISLDRIAVGGGIDAEVPVYKNRKELGRSMIYRHGNEIKAKFRFEYEAEETDSFCYISNEIKKQGRRIKSMTIIGVDIIE